VLLPDIRHRAELRSSSSEDTDTYIRRALKTFNVPGFAIAVVRDGKGSGMEIASSHFAEYVRACARHRHRQLQNEVGILARRFQLRFSRSLFYAGFNIAADVNAAGKGVGIFLGALPPSGANGRREHGQANEA
jgi:hypothetical protein